MRDGLEEPDNGLLTRPMPLARTLPLARWRRVLYFVDRLPLELRLVLLLAAILHGAGLSWGMPGSDAWDNDGVAPRDVFPGLISTFTPGDYYTYPPLHLAIVALLTLPVTIAAVVRAGSTSAAAVIQEIVKPPYMTTITMTARIVTLLMSLGIVAIIAFVAAEVAPRERRRSVATFAALFATLNWTFSYYSHTSNLDVPYLFWASLALLWLVRAIARLEPRRLRAFAAFAALAVATKDQAYAMFLLGAPAALVVWAWLDRWPRENRRLPREILREIAIATIVGVVLVLVIDGALFNPSGFRARIAFLTGPASKNFEILSRDVRGYVLAFIDSFLYFRRHYPPALAIFVVLGIGVAIARARKLGSSVFAASLAPLLVALSFSLCFNVAALRAEERFTLPQMLVAAVYAGSGLDRLWNGRGGAPRWVARAACVAALLLASIECIRVVATLFAEPRYDTEAFLAANAGPSDTIETHGLNVSSPAVPAGAAGRPCRQDRAERRGISTGCSVEAVKAAARRH